MIERKPCLNWMGLFASPDYIERAGSPRLYSDLADHRILGWRGDLAEGGYASFLDEIEPDKISYGSNNLVVHRVLAENGLGIAFLPQFFGAASDRLLSVLPNFRRQAGAIWILHHDDYATRRGCTRLSIL